MGLHTEVHTYLLSLKPWAQSVSAVTTMFDKAVRVSECTHHVFDKAVRISECTHHVFDKAVKVSECTHHHV